MAMAVKERPTEIEPKKTTDVSARRDGATTARVAEIVEKEGNGILSLLRTAVESGADVAALERLVALHERIEAQKAEREMTAALARFQAEVPQIRKSRTVRYTTKRGEKVSYSYAEIDAIDSAIRPVLTRHGLSYRWNVASTTDGLAVTCYIEHVCGGARTATFPVPVEDRTGMSAAQNVAAALTYARRQTLIMALGLATTDEDNDARDIEDAAQDAFGDRPRVYEDGGDDEYAERGDDGPHLTCPKCGGPVYDNRADIEAGRRSNKYPRWKCRDRECGWASWKDKYEDAVAADPRHQRTQTGVLTRTLGEKLTRAERTSAIVRLAADGALRMASAANDGLSDLQKIVRRYGGKTSKDLPDAHLARIHAALAAIKAGEADLSYGPEGTPMCVVAGDDYFAPPTEEIAL